MADCAVTSSKDAARAALDRDPFDPAALHALGTAVLRGRHPAQAAALLSAAAAIDPRPAVLRDLGIALSAAGRKQEAEQHLRRALSLRPDHAATLAALAELLTATDRVNEAVLLLRQAAGAATDDPAVRAALGQALNLQGNAAYASGDMQAAEALYRQALAAVPASAPLRLNHGNALTGLLRLPEAKAAYRAALALDPDYNDAAFALSLALLLNGETSEGMRLYERRRLTDLLRPNYVRRPDLKDWHPGDGLPGQRVLVTAEQGYGDIIQYARFVPALADVAAGVVLELPWALADAFRGLPGVSRIIGPEQPEHGCDIACPLLSLPLALGIEAPPAPPYVTILPEREARWAAWLDRSGPGRRIGLVCSGDPAHGHDKRRSFPLSLLDPLLDLPGMTFVLVQAEIRETDRDTFDRLDDLRCPEAALTDFADTAALLSGLDLLVSVDTAVAHLAGAMAMPVWTLLPYYPDCRWMLGCCDSPWYPTMRLYRQPSPGAWDAVIRRVRDDLVRQGER